MLCVAAGLLAGGDAFGQTTKVNTDSIRLARQRGIDSSRAAQQERLDSARLARQHVADSMKAFRKHVADSLAAIRDYRESRHFKDSVASVRQARLDSIKSARTAYNDSIRAAQQRVTDSLVAARKAALDSARAAREAYNDSVRVATKRTMDSMYAVRKATMDSIKAIQKQRSDSLAAIRKYRESKRYKDSVALVRQIRLDSTIAARKKINDSAIAARKRALDSATASRKMKADSMTAARTKVSDSLKAVRKIRTDSLAKMKLAREKQKKVNEKKKEERFNLALELKIKKKHEAWSNEKMLKKKWSFPRRFLQNTYTHYNYFFNADRKMEEALNNMQQMRKENYDTLIALFPFDPDRDSTALASDMDSIIQKTSIGIQIHDPRTKWADDLYLLMGQAYYYKGNYSEAATAFRYIIATNQQAKAKEQKKAAGRKKSVDKDVSIVQKEEKGALDFLKRESANNEAVLWLARTYTEGHKEDDAEAILDLIETDKNLPEDMKGRIALEKAYLNLGRNNRKAAASELAIVANDEYMPDWLRTRAAYMSGQLQFENGNYAAAATDFQRVIDLKPKIEMDFYARKNLAYSMINSGGDQQQAAGTLKGLLKDGKYAPYYEQVYYVLGRLSATGNDLDEAVGYLRKSIESPKSTKKQKALSFATLGNVYYTKGNYKDAKLSYDSAAALARYAPNEELITTAAKRAKVLDKIAGPAQTINDQDSLLALAGLSEKEQRNRAKQYIRLLEQRIEDSISKAENAVAGGDVMMDPADPGDGGANWYFSNVALVKQGYNDFKRKWGSRQNVDNWRRAGGAALANNSGGLGSEGEENEETDERGLPTEASLLALIPNTPEKQEQSRKSIQKAYVEMAGTYVNDLEDFPSATRTLDTLDKRFASHDHRAEELYLRYQIALKENRLNDAQQLVDKLLKDHNNTEWAKQVTPSQDTRGLLASANGVSVANYYDETYGLMMQRDYSTVLQRVKDGQKQYNDPVYNNRFVIMEAIALAGAGNYDQADTLLKQFISTHPSDSLRPWAESVMSYVKKNKPIVIKVDGGKDSTAGKVSPGAGSPLDSNAVVPGAGTANLAPPPASYKYDTKAKHYFLFLFNKMESKAMGVKAGLSDYNTFKFSSQGLSANLQMLQPTQGLIVVKSFPTAAHARIYMNSLKGNNTVFREYKPEEYQMGIISEDNYRKLEADKDLQPYLQFYKANYK